MVVTANVATSTKPEEITLIEGGTNTIRIMPDNICMDFKNLEEINACLTGLHMGLTLKYNRDPNS